MRIATTVRRELLHDGGTHDSDGLTRRREFVDARAERRRNLILAAEGVLHRALLRGLPSQAGAAASAATVALERTVSASSLRGATATAKAPQHVAPTPVVLEGHLQFARPPSSSGSRNTAD